MSLELKDFKTRSSGRDFTGKTLTAKELEDLIEIINNSPTSTNSQQFSAVIITEQDTKNWVSKMNWHQQHLVDAAAIILFVADRTRIAKVLEDNPTKAVSPTFLKHEFFRGTVDATIAATYAHDALLAMGYGVTFIGGPLTYASELHEKLSLPDTAMVVVGLSVGQIKKKGIFKPKMNKVFLEKYSKDQAYKDLRDYDKTLKDHYEEIGVESDYSKLIVNTTGADEGYVVSFEKAGRYISEKFKNYK